MLSYSTKLCLAEVLIQAAQIEKEIEFLREKLCSINQFHPYIAFKNIDRLSNFSKGQIEASDIQLFLNTFDLKFTLEECRIFINNYDQDEDGRLQYSEFLKVVLPVKNLELRQTISLKQPIAGTLNFEAQETLANIISRLYYIRQIQCREILLTIEAEKIKQRLRSSQDFNIYLCFLEIDKYHTNRLLSEDIKQYLWSHGLMVTHDEVNHIFRRLDFYNDGVVDEKEFIKYLEIRNLQLIPLVTDTSAQKINLIDRSYKTPVKAKVTYKNDNSSVIDTSMSNILSVSKVQKKKPSRSLNKSQQRSFSMKETKEMKTPQKYLQQKTKLRAQLQLSKLLSEKKQTPPSKQKRQQSAPRNHSAQKKKIDLPVSQGPGFFFASILMEIMLKEQQLEHRRIRLARQKDFNIYDGFRAVDKDRVGYVASTDLDYFVSKRGQMSILIKKYGSSGRMRFSQQEFNIFQRFSDFVKMIQPQSIEYQRYLDRKIPSTDSSKFPIDQIFSKETLKQMRELLEFILELELNLDKLRNKIHSYKYPNLREAFLMIDCYTRDGIISESDLEQYFYENNIRFNEEDVSLLLQKLDVNNDGKVTENDFSALLSV